MKKKIKATFLISMIFLASLTVYGLTANKNLSNAVESPSTSLHLTAQSIVKNDSNWAGYIASLDFQNASRTVTTVNASWIVPQVKPSVNDSFSAVWIGIGGFFDRSLLQVGSEQDFINGSAVYNLWYETLPADAIPIEGITVNPGDKINASITLLDPIFDLWSVYIADGSQVFRTTVQYQSTKTSAEWILERPVLNGNLTILANTSSVTFTDCYATINNQTKNIGNFSNVQSLMFQRVQNMTGFNQLAYVSNLSQSGSSFTVTTFDSTIPEFTTWLVLSLLLATALAVIVIKKRVKKSRLT